MSKTENSLDTDNLKKISETCTRDTMREIDQVIEVEYNPLTRDIVLVPAWIRKDNRSKIIPKCLLNLTTPQALDLTAKIISLIMSKDQMDASLVLEILRHSISKVSL